MEIPKQIGDEWSFLHSEVICLHGRWRVYCDLYGKSAARINLLNRAAPGFFGILQGMWLNDVQLTLSKLGDPAGTGERTNLTLERFLQVVSAICRPQLSAKLTQLVAEYRTACQKVTERRNKDIAHFDYKIHVKPERKAEILPGPSRREIDAALCALRQFMRAVCEHFGHTYMVYEAFSPLGGANQLLHLMKEGLRYEEHVEAGTIDKIDISKSPYFEI